MKLMILEGYVAPPSSTRSSKRGGAMKLGTAARKCKGKKAGAFRACVKRVMKGGPVGGKRRKSRRRNRR